MTTLRKQGVGPPWYKQTGAGAQPSSLGSGRGTNKEASAHNHRQSTEAFHQPEKFPGGDWGDRKGGSSSADQRGRSEDAKECLSCYHVQRRTGILRQNPNQQWEHHFDSEGSSSLG